MKRKNAEDIWSSRKNWSQKTKMVPVPVPVFSFELWNCICCAGVLLSVLSTVSLALGGGLIVFAILYTLGNVTSIARSLQSVPIFWLHLPGTLRKI